MTEPTLSTPAMPTSLSATVTFDKTFDPAAIEAKWAAYWEANGLFRPPGTPERPRDVPFTIVNPPPNVTGSLHVGHALDNTLQDIVVRYERLRGRDALWVVGTDHAGIATQMVVERQLEAAGDKRAHYSREAFVDKVWAWKAQSGGTITGQLRRLGCSMDWSREQFTMDPHFSRAVTKVFVDLYNQGLIYRDKRLVNWDPKLKTAISDLEVETREIAGKFWHLRYPLADGSDALSVATTRPETMLADMAVAVHPDDARYAALVGKQVRLPVTGRLIPIIADQHADPALGSGAVKITPGHDFNDFEVGKRAGIAPAAMLNMFDAEARVVQVADGAIPAGFVGLDRFEARALVVETLGALGLVERVEERVIPTPYGDRGGVVIEPWLTDQWYVNAAALAGAPMQAVRDGAIEIVPKTWEKTFFNWMETIQPWCISRQLWWGHRIPAWYGPDGTIFVAESVAEARAQAGGLELRQDEDVLDTWFSSALWPFATLGWPQDAAGVPPSRLREGPGVGSGEAQRTDAPTPQPPPAGARGSDLLARHYPNDLLISGFDILFFWCARMAMMGQHLMGDVPWKRLYLHGLVRAADGQKMSKSKGNVVDPLGLIDTYGADALRFFMAAMESQGRDVKMDEKRIEGYRNFATKLWNAARFCQANGVAASTSLAAPPATQAVNRWVIGAVVDTLGEMDRALAELRFDTAANAILHFVRDQFCDWYIELVKGQFDAETRLVAGWAMDQILVMLHPFMPFVTEELWDGMGARETALIAARWPEPGAAVNVEATREVEWLIDLVGNLRAAKAELGIAPGARLDAFLPEPSAAMRAMVGRNAGAIDRVARLSVIHFAAPPGGAAMQIGAGDATLIVPLAGIIDIAAEQSRLTRALALAQKEATALAARLANPAFAERAKPEAVAKARTDHAQHSAEAERLAAALARLG